LRIAYYEEEDTLYIELAKGQIIRDESVGWNMNIGYTMDGIGEITILDAAEGGFYPIRVEKVTSRTA
jgi:uncharacterized protein YuzE